MWKYRLWWAAWQRLSCWFKNWYLVSSHGCKEQGWSHGRVEDYLILWINSLRCISDLFQVVFYLIINHVTTPECIEFNLCEVCVHVTNMGTVTIKMSLLAGLFFAWCTPSNKPGFALRQDVLPMQCVNCVWPLSTKNVLMSCGSGCRYENVRLQWAVMYTRGGGGVRGWWPAEAPDVQCCLGRVLCCKCV